MLVETVRQRVGPQRVQLWFQDEARFGQQGTLTRVWADRGLRAVAPKQTEYEWVYMFGAVCPAEGLAHGWLMPLANTEIMNLYLEDFGRQLPKDVHALMVLDRAGWHRSRKLRVPTNVTLVYLPPYAPELNPAELLWREQRSKGTSNRVLPSLEDLEQVVACSWMDLETNPERLRSLCFFPWIRSAVIN